MRSETAAWATSTIPSSLRDRAFRGHGFRVADQDLYILGVMRREQNIAEDLFEGL